MKSALLKIFSGKKNTQIGLIVLCAITALCACSSHPHVDGFDNHIWKNDHLGCNSQREKHYNKLLQQKKKIIGIQENTLLRWLGPPDAKDLYTRNKKSYIYFVSPGEQCNNTDKPGKKIVFEISALGKVNMVREEII
ncbi:MAG: hypothetical protein NZ529_06375 [Cytophagaceae bacterium]|nr:hypothetical protein [Cytophagaceae bacterium]MDW8456404.1 hypothetical protein [Cytophagaceae bacterium]